MVLLGCPIQLEVGLSMSHNPERVDTLLHAYPTDVAVNFRATLLLDTDAIELLGYSSLHKLFRVYESLDSEKDQ